MRKTKTGDVPTRRTRSRTLRLNEASSRLIDREGGVLSQELAVELSPSIVSLSSFDRDSEELHSRCTGIIVLNEPLGASFVTSRDLVLSKDSVFIRTLKIKVHLPNGEVLNASVQYYSIAHNMLVVTTEYSPDLRAASLPPMQVESSTRLLAASLCGMSDKFWVTTGVLTDSPVGVESNGTMWSMCKITEAGSGGPLVDFDGNIVGMNLRMTEGITPFVPARRIVECMHYLGFRIYLDDIPTALNLNSEGTSSLDTTVGSSSQNGSSEGSAKQEPCAFPIHGDNGVWSDVYLGPDVYWDSSEDPYQEIQKNSTPHSDDPKGRTDDELRSILAPWRPDGDGMYLKWDFEEGFGKDIRSEPTKKVASKMSRSVVALASFIVENPEGSGEHRNEKKIARQFACTGVFIEGDESATRILTSASLVRKSGDEKNIHPEWKIEVCLPSKRCVDGTLQHYDLKYNVVVVSIEGVRSYRAAKVDGTSQTKVGAQLVALGRGFESGKLMATSGAVTGKRSRCYCEELQISTCKITKAGIGGPLVDFDGNFVGMNFYDTEETPYLSSVIILELMRRFNVERNSPVAVKAPDESEFPSWPVPDPEWFYPSRYPKRP